MKNNAYFKRFQVKLRRRREGKTDYYARKRLIFQAKNKYNTPKYRFVVRRTNRNIVCQVIYATLLGDRVLCEAQSKELKRFGLEAGLSNYSAAYGTGLLLARRLLKQVGLDKLYKGVGEATGQDFDVYKDMETRASKGEEITKRPFKAVMDVGLIHTTTGNRVFGALKGACDGGLHVPHSTKRFPGSSKDEDKWVYDAEVHRKRIYGHHVQDYMNHLKEDDTEKYNLVFSKWNAVLKGKNLEQLYKQVFKGIRENPDHVKKQRAHPPVHVRQGTDVKTHTGTYPRLQKLTNEERKEKVKQKILKATESA